MASQAPRPAADLPGLTLRALVAGIAFGIVFVAANAYLGLRVGLTVSTSIPTAVLTGALFRLMPARLESMILEANISQTAGAASSSLASGTIFTIPALFMWGMAPPLWQVAILALLGGLLGIAAMGPLRRLLIVKSADELPYPEGTACAEVLRATTNAATGGRWIFSKGYYGVKVEHKIDYLETNEAVITFKIEEGVKGHIKKIVFKGNKNIKSSDLKKFMLTKQKNILSIITKTCMLDEDILKNDVQMLTAYYIDHGYLDVKISEPKIDLQNPKRIRVEVEISEGPQYRIGEIDFKRDILTTKEDLFRSIKIKRNAIYSTSAVRRDINSISEKFANQGYANVDISPFNTTDAKNLLVHLTFEIEKKKQVSFEKIQIVGNAKTRDKVIRRELRVAEEELAGGVQPRGTLKEMSSSAWKSR